MGNLVFCTKSNTVNSRTPVAYDAQALLYLARGEEFAVEMPTLPDFVNPNLVQQLNVVFKKENSPELTDKVSELYPNPSSGTVFFTHTLDNNQTATCTIYDSSGRLMTSIAFNGSGTQTIDVANYSPGLYYYAITVNNTIIARNKLVVIN